MASKKNKAMRSRRRWRPGIDTFRLLRAFPVSRPKWMRRDFRKTAHFSTPHRPVDSIVVRDAVSPIVGHSLRLLTTRTRPDEQRLAGAAVWLPKDYSNFLRLGRLRRVGLGSRIRAAACMETGACSTGPRERNGNLPRLVNKPGASICRRSFHPLRSG